MTEVDKSLMGKVAATWSIKVMRAWWPVLIISALLAGVGYFAAEEDVVTVYRLQVPIDRLGKVRSSDVTEIRVPRRLVDTADTVEGGFDPRNRMALEPLRAEQIVRSTAVVRLPAGYAYTHRRTLTFPTSPSASNSLVGSMVDLAFVSSRPQRGEAQVFEGVLVVAVDSSEEGSRVEFLVRAGEVAEIVATAGGAEAVIIERNGS